MRFRIFLPSFARKRCAYEETSLFAFAMSFRGPGAWTQSLVLPNGSDFQSGGNEGYILPASGALSSSKFLMLLAWCFCLKR